VGFVKSEALGAAYHGDLFTGLSVPLPLGGPLFRFNLTQNRQRLAVDAIEAENEDFNSLIGSEELLIGTNFGVVTDIETGANGNLFVVSLSNGAVYEISMQTEAESVHLTATLTGAAEVPGLGILTGRATPTCSSTRRQARSARRSSQGTSRCRQPPRTSISGRRTSPAPWWFR
jgi:hypothetical protein